MDLSAIAQADLVFFAHELSLEATPRLSLEVERRMAEC